MSPDGRSATQLVAAVDCGTNSTRLLLAHVDDGGLRPVVRRTAITRLGGGVDATGHLTAAAIARVTDVLERYAEEWRDAGVTQIGVSATSAVRDTIEPQPFLTAVRQATGVDPVVLTGEQEAALTFAGATTGRAGRLVVCDIGGGSTELIVGAGTVDRWASMQVGSVRLRERHLRSDPPSPAEYAALVTDIDAVMAAQDDAFAAADGRPLVAVAGTALTVAAVASGSADPDVDRVEGAVLSAADVGQVVEDLAWLTTAERRATHPPIVPGREDVIVAGALLLARLLSRFGFTAVEVCVSDLLDGVAARVGAGAWPPWASNGVT
jgi:exopolyphosphatase/guanosine-5'-triphosphate,3'-diphosphate pyrophosphatase